MLCNVMYCYLITPGYIGSTSFLNRVINLIGELKEVNPQLIYGNVLRSTTINLLYTILGCIEMSFKVNGALVYIMYFSIYCLYDSPNYNLLSKLFLSILSNYIT